MQRWNGKYYSGWCGISPLFLTIGDGGECSGSRSGRLIPRKHTTHSYWIWGWVGPRGGGEGGRIGDEKYFFFLPEIEPRFFGRPYRSPVTVITELSRLHSSAVSNPDLHISGRCLASYSGEDEQVKWSCKSFIFLSTQIGPKLFHT